MFDYEKLWKLLKKRELKKVDLKKFIGITPATLAKLNRNQNVSMDVLNRLCVYLECDIGDIVEHVYTPYKTDESLGTFAPNKKEDIHNWFSYLEGYSSSLVETELDKLKGVKSILDPFGGSGTTPLVGVLRGLTSYYCETNPVMAFVTRVKTDVAFSVLTDPSKITLFYNYKTKLIQFLKDNPFSGDALTDMQGFQKYFESENIYYITLYKKYLDNINDKFIKDMFNIALAGVSVNVSKMIRRGDLRYAKGKELSKTNQNFINAIEAKLNRIYLDLKNIKISKVGTSIYLTEDARNINKENIVDAVITSPPYLNGTNYIRNTKLELKLLDFVSSEKDLSKLHKKGIVSGINNVSVSTRVFNPIKPIEDLINKLDAVSYDSRIPKMVIAYFNDMNDVFYTLSKAIKDKGYLIMDIGDSQFAGVHIPTHKILIDIAECYGFILYENEIIRRRKSRSGFELTQRILRFRMNKNDDLKRNYREKAKCFLEKMSYQDKGRNWGHPWHSLCSYRGKLKPAIANELINEFTEPGDRVLDPMSGVGTVPLEACLQGRIGIANDLSKLAYVVSRAKVERPSLESVKKSISDLNNYIKKNKDQFSDNEEVKTFGLNKNIVDYFHPETMKEILAARSYYMERDLTSADCVVMSCFMHILHGNRPYALSRTSHSLTPYAPKGPFLYKNVIEHLQDKVLRSYKAIENEEPWTKGESYNCDMVKLSNYLKKKNDVIITSPPFASSFNFYTQNWLRLWFCGWGRNDFDNADMRFFDNLQNKDMDIYYSFFQSCSDLLKKNGKLIIHVGKSKKIDMANELVARCARWFEVVEVGEEKIDGESHGVTDKGATIAHQFVFLLKKS